MNWKKPKDLEDTVELMLRAMCPEEKLTFIPESFINAAVKGFLIGMLVKGYEKNSWMTLNVSSSSNLSSFKRHIKALEHNLPDKDTGINDAVCFVAARAVMQAEIADKEKRPNYSNYCLPRPKDRDILHAEKLIDEVTSWLEKLDNKEINE